ncbi:MAG: DNA polymerase Y family protein, partial [Candidatus Eisenbacteria bacterium]|nr:DNA polymerase Y family protein [Candidatus Eisenbacteria bacterium]
MDRIACIDLPAFPLQLLMLRHPEWKDGPVAVVEHDRPQGRILWVNEAAREERILPGMRYAAGLS